MDECIRIHREIMECDFYGLQPFDKLHAWIDLIFLARTFDGYETIGNIVLFVKRGQVPFSNRLLSKRWQWSRQKVVDFLKAMTEAGFLRIVKRGKISVIDINEYEKYKNTDFSQTKGQKKPQKKPQTHVCVSNCVTESCKKKDVDCEGQSGPQKKPQTKKQTAFPYNKVLKNNKVLINNEEYINMNNKNKKELSSEEDNKKKEKTEASDTVVSVRPCLSCAASFNKLKDFWNDRMRDKKIPCINSITPRRMSNILARQSEYGTQAVYDVIDRAAESRFLNGDNNRGFIASFDWIYRPNNFPKVLEGNFANFKKENKCCVDLNKFVEYFNKQFQYTKIPQIKEMTHDRIEKLNAVCVSHKSDIQEVVRRVKNSAYLRGDDGRGFKASFDWIFNYDNFIKILEGNYDD